MELVFPITATLLVYLVAVPVGTIIARAFLEWHEHRWPHPHEAGDSVTFAALVAPVLIPSIAMGAAALHRIDGHHAMEACIAMHEAAEACGEALILAGLIGLPLALAGLYKLRLTRRNGRRLDLSDELGVDVYLVDGGTICVRGLVSPWIELGADVRANLTVEQLRSALLHEVAHARGFDPLLHWFVRATLAANPASQLLERWFDRWHLGREIRCDLAALDRGADRFDMAESLLAVARLGAPVPRGACALTGAAASIRLRVAILVGGDPPSVASDRNVWLGYGAFLVALGIACMVCELTFLDALHQQSERVFHALL